LAERELREFLVLQFLGEKHLGDEFTAVVTGLISSGVFVSIDRFLIEGRVRWQDIGNDGALRSSSSSESRVATRPWESDRRGRERPGGWLVNESTGRARAARSGAEIAVGDIVTVQIVAVDLSSRHLDLLITKMPMRTAAPQREKGAREHRHADERGT